MGLWPPSFGPLYWAVIHMVSQKYDVLDPAFPHQNAEREQLKGFYGALAAMLLCPGCAMHCRLYMSQHPPPLEEANKDNRAMWKWSVDFHNAVNVRTGKPEYSYADAENYIKSRFLNIKDWRETKRALQIREEDTAYIKRLQKELTEAGVRPPTREQALEEKKQQDQNRAKQNISSSGGSESDASVANNTKLMVAIVVILLVIILLMFFLM